jgi:membrane-associated phospholipid phosphatase
MTQARIEQYLNNHLTTRYPAVTRWLAARLTTENFRGLPLTALVGLLIITVMTLSEVAENIVNSEPMVQVDTAFTHWLFQARTSGLSQFFYGVTWLGSIYATVSALVIGSIVLFRQHKRRNVFILWFVVVGMGASVQLGKRTFVRARPLQVAYYPETGYSFPSGHSATAMAMYGLLGYWFVRSVHRYRRLIGAGAVTLILSVGFSRIYLGVHFLSDVLGGYLLGICWVIAGIVLTEWQRTTHQPEVG